MKRFAVIGLGHFGSYVARRLYAEGEEVIAVDLDADAVQEAADFSTQATVADATVKKTLEALGIQDVDIAIVSLGEKMDVITLVALYLIELGVPHIAVKAITEDHAKILKAIGVNEIIHPEQESAVRLATRLMLNDVIDFLPILSGFSVVSMRATPIVIGKQIKDLESKNIQVVAIQHKTQKSPTLVPDDDEPIFENDILILIGENQEIAKFTAKYCKE